MTGDASGVGAVNERDGSIKWDVDGAAGPGGGEGVPDRSIDFDTCPKAGPAVVSLDIVGMSLFPLFPEVTRFDLMLGVVPEELCVYCRKKGEPRAEVLIDFYRIAEC